MFENGWPSRNVAIFMHDGIASYYAVFLTSDHSNQNYTTLESQ